LPLWKNSQPVSAVPVVSAILARLDRRAQNNNYLEQSRSP
jgi:hypothetical protein